MVVDNNPIYRYPGTKPFEATESELFMGRDEDINNLYELLSIQSLIVLFGRSGLGKSSLLNAGLVNNFKNDPNLVPVFIRFGAFYDKNKSTPLEKFYEVLSNEQQTKSYNFIYEKLISSQDITMHHLWYLFKSLRLTNPTKQKYILIFDQFEELFTYPEDDINLFKKELSELIYLSVPQQLRNLLKDKLLLDPDYLTLEEKDQLFSPLNIKILFSIRSDKLSLLNKLNDNFPSLMEICYELKPLNKKQARQAIEDPAKLIDNKYISPPYTFSKEAINLLLDYLSNAKFTKNDDTTSSNQEIATFQLQIVCKYIENLVIGTKLKQISAGDLDNIKGIFENHYKNIIADLEPSIQLPARKLIEEKLIIDGNRVSMPILFILKDEGMTKELLDKLFSTHLLRPGQDNTVEISHDTLIEPILKYYDERKKQEALVSELQEKEEQIKKIKKDQEIKSKRNTLIIRTVVAFSILTLCLAGYAIIQSINSKNNARLAEISAIKADSNARKAERLTIIADQLRKESDSNANIIHEILFESDTLTNHVVKAQNSSPSFIALSRAFKEYKSGAREIPSASDAGPFVSKYLKSMVGLRNDTWNVAFVIWCFTFGEMKNKLLDFRTAALPADFLNRLKSKKYVINFPVEKPKPGDIVFFDFGEHKGATTCGIVFNLDEEYIYTIEGDVEGKVKTVKRYLGDANACARIF